MRILKAIFIVFKLLGKHSVRLLRETFKWSNLTHKDNFFGFILLFAFFYACSIIGGYINALDPVADAFADVELTDVMYSQLDKNSEFREYETEDGEKHVQADTNITVVNIGFINRAQTAALINIIEGCDPKVVGIDAFYSSRRDSVQDSLFRDELMEHDNIVMVSEGLQYDKENLCYDSIRFSDPFFSEHTHSGLANMVTEDMGEGDGQFNVCRKFIPKSPVRSTESIEYCFGAKVAGMYMPESLERLDKRGRDTERINFIGNIYIPFFQEKYPKRTIPELPFPYYRSFDFSEVFNFEFDSLDFKNKIVLLGFLGERIYIDEGQDKFYTPLNHNYIGKANKDMYGVILHANIISTIIHEIYIDELWDSAKHIIGIISVFFVLALFRPIYNDYKVWYDGVTKTISLFITLIILFIIGIVFEFTNFELKFGAIYLACILLAGDFMEFYYGLVKNLGRKTKENL